MVMAEEKQAIVFVRDEISELILLVATEKGAFLYYSDSDRRHWDVTVSYTHLTLPTICSV